MNVKIKLSSEQTDEVILAGLRADKEMLLEDPYNCHEKLINAMDVVMQFYATVYPGDISEEND